jgi:hypothetical protein
LSEQPKISDSDIVALFHNSSLEASKAFQIMHNSFINVLQELEKLKQVNYQLSEKLKLLEEIKEEKK